jgi:hypothetical protein
MPSEHQETRQDPVTTLGVCLMKRRLAPTLIAIMLIGAATAQAQAQRRGPSLSVVSARAAIDRFAGELTYQITGAGTASPVSWQVSACARGRVGVRCTGEWTVANRKCSVGMEALRGRSAIRVRQLGKVTCSEENDGVVDRAP